MGHYASEMDPSWGPSIERTDRVMKLQKRLALASLKDFNVGDIGVLYKLMENSSNSLTDEEIRYLEKKADAIISLKKRNRNI